MRASCLKIITLLLTLLIFTGCWDAKEIQEHTIVTGLVIDHKDDKYYYYAETAVVHGGGGGGESAFIEYKMIESGGKSFVEARDALERSTNFPILASSIRVAIFTHNLCHTGIEGYLNRIRGEFDYRKTVLIAATSEDGKEIIQHKPVNTPSISAAIDNLFRSMTNAGISFEISIGEILEYLAVKNVGYLLPQIDIENDQFILSGHCVMKNDKRIGHIPAEVMDGNMCLKVKKRQFEYQTNYNNNNYTIKVRLKKRKIKPKIKNGEIFFDVELKFNGTIVYAEKMTKLSKNEVKMMAKQVQNEFQAKIDEAIDRAQNEFKCDYLDFFKHFRAKYQKEFREIEDWNQAFSKAKINTKVDVNIVGTSMLSIEKD